MRLLNLAELETAELLAVKPGRNRAEYCWTLTPWSIQWVLEAEPIAHRVTYLDADVFFLNSPSPIFAEFESSGRGVLITEHGYAPEYDQTPTSGKYCVQFLTICSYTGIPVLEWWRDRCLEWCFARSENGLFGDQKYLESFPVLFPSLFYEIGADSRFQGPWNASICPFSKAIAFHFHGLRIIDYRLINISTYSLPTPHLQYVYLRYCLLLQKIIQKYSLPFASQGVKPSGLSLFALRFKHLLAKHFFAHHISPKWFCSSIRQSSFKFI